MKKVAITGVSGFIGSHVYKYFKSMGYETVLISSNHKFIAEHEAIAFDALISDDLIGVDVVVHCAGIAHKKDVHAVEAFNEYFESNSVKTLDLFNKSKSANVKMFIYLSSANVCNPVDNKISSLSELLPLDMNSFSKVVSERMIKLFSDKSMKFTIIRCPLVYGPGVKGNFSSIVKLVDRMRILPFGCFGNVKKSMVSIYNLLDLIKVCIANPNSANEIFLVSDGEDLSVLDIFRLLATLRRRKVFMLPIPILFLSCIGFILGKRKLINNISNEFRINIEYTKKQLDWEPPYGVKASLSQFVNKKP
jgi:nucleoside-diphosphate-sugar epimerase